jgi:endonuclease/exonuclease/phosphatase (EEP) superfamily protein YafD
MARTTNNLASCKTKQGFAKVLFFGLVALCIVLTALAESERLWWRAYLIAQFRVEIFALAAITTVLIAAFRGSTMLAVCTSLCAVITFSHLIAYYVPRAQPLMASARTLKLMQINLNVKNRQFEKVTSYVQSVNPDIALFAELTPEWQTYLNTHLKSHPHSVAVSRMDTYGIGIYSKSKAFNEQIVYLGESGHPSIIAEYTGLEKPVSILHTHVQGPVKKHFFEWHKQQFEAMLPTVKKLKTPLVVCGDLNSNAWTYLITDLLNQSGLNNTQWGRGIQLTWPTPFYWRYGFFPLLAIDHFFVSDDVVCKTRRLGVPNSSDHYPVIIDISL